jgi:hypothetical protein
MTVVGMIRVVRVEEGKLGITALAFTDAFFK